MQYVPTVRLLNLNKINSQKKSQQDYIKKQIKYAGTGHNYYQRVFFNNNHIGVIPMCFSYEQLQCDLFFGTIATTLQLTTQAPHVFQLDWTYGAYGKLFCYNKLYLI